MKVDVSLLDGQIAILEHAIMRYVTTGQAPGPSGNRHPSISPFEPYATADRPLVIAAGNDALFLRLCQALGRAELAGDPRFLTNADRNRHADQLKEMLEQTLVCRRADHWLRVLDEAGVPCSLVNSVADAVEHPQIRSRNMIVEAQGVRMAGNPIKLSAFADPVTRSAAPDLDADGAHIRQELATGRLRREPRQD
jgi:CoA:oxalate CoA-transferase